MSGRILEFPRSVDPVAAFTSSAGAQGSQNQQRAVASTESQLPQQPCSSPLTLTELLAITFGAETWD